MKGAIDEVTANKKSSSVKISNNKKEVKEEKK